MIIDINKLETALNYVAACIESGDDALFPIFERLEFEIEELQKKESAIDRVRRITAARAKPSVQKKKQSDCGFLTSSLSSSHLHNAHGHVYA